MRPEIADGVGSRGPWASTSWRINAERLVILGWPAAILAQVAHPLVAAGVDDHSIAVNDPRQRVQRFRHTIAAMLALTFGARAEAATAAAGIRTIHDRVHGALGEDAGAVAAGTRYSAHDPDLLRWVHATLLETLPRAYELYVGPLAREDRERLCQEGQIMEAALGMPEGSLPASVVDLRAYIDEMLGGNTIVIGTTASRLARVILARPQGWLLYLPAVGLLPPAIRKAYGFRWTRGHEAALRLSGAIVRAVLPRIPARWRYWDVARFAALQVEQETGRLPRPSHPKLTSHDVEALTGA